MQRLLEEAEQRWDRLQMEPMVQQIETEQTPLPEGSEYYVDGGFVTIEDRESMGQRRVTVFAPPKEVEKQQQQGKDPYAPKRGDSPEVAEWRHCLSFLADRLEAYPTASASTGRRRG